MNIGMHAPAIAHLFQLGTREGARGRQVEITLSALGDREAVCYVFPIELARQLAYRINELLDEELRAYTQAQRGPFKASMERWKEYQDAIFAKTGHRRHRKTIEKIIEAGNKGLLD